MGGRSVIPASGLVGMWEGSSLCDVAAQQHLVLGGNQEAMIGPGPTGREEVWEERRGILDPCDSPLGK